MKHYLLIFTFSLIFSADYYVSLSGNNFSGDGTEENPFKSITRAINVFVQSSNTNAMIYVDEGTYSYSTSGDLFPINIPSNVNIIGADRELTIIDALRSGRAITFVNSSTSSLNKVTVTGGDTTVNPANPATGAGIYISNSSPSFIEVDVIGNYASYVGGGIDFRNNSEIFLLDVRVIGNYSAQNGAGIYGYLSSAILENVIISDNVSEQTGGGFDSYACPSIIFKNLEVSNNSAIYSGGGMSLGNFGVDVGVYDFENVLFYGNRAGHSGGGLFCNNSNISFKHATFVDNIANYYNDPVNTHHGGGISTWDSNVSAVNSIVRGNYLNDESQDIEKRNTGQFLLSHSNIGELWGVSSAGGNMNVDPLFVNPASGDYSLSSDSPCIDAGTSFFQAFGNTVLDLSESSYNGSAPDMGAFEYTVSFGDLNDDTIINVQDIVLIVGLVLNDGYSLPADLNSDGIVNVLDIVALVNLILG